MVTGKQSSSLTVNDNLTEIATEKSVFGLRTYVLVAICVGVFFAITILIVIIRSHRKSRKLRINVHHSSALISIVGKDVSKVKEDERTQYQNKENVDSNFDLLEKCSDDVDKSSHHRISSPGEGKGSLSVATVEVSVIGWGRWYSLRELEVATNGFSEENIVGEGGFGTVYKGVLPDNSVVAVKYLFNNKGQAEKEFKAEVETIGKVRHKNLVGLVGYCAEESQRLLVYEFIENGNLDQWLHDHDRPSSPLTWDIRMKIAIDTAKGLAYLHEGLEPKVVHRDVKSSNILLDKQWNAKVSDFGLAKLLGSNSSYVTTRVMGTFGYVAPEYARSGMLTERSDVYSFGILLMEIISGRIPVDYNRPAGEVKLVEWFKRMVGDRRVDEVLDPLVEVSPPSRVLKRILLVCLRCIDMDARRRPKMGQVVHMLEADEFSFRSECQSGQATSSVGQVGFDSTRWI